MKVISTFIIFTLASFLFLLVTSFLGFYSAIRPPRILSPITPRTYDLEYEQVEFTTQDNIVLRGWFIPSAQYTKKTIVGLHGYPADKGNILPVLAPLADHFNLFLFDFRYFGESEGIYSTVGAREVLDLQAAIEYLITNDQERIGVWGLSMGGAVALMAHAEPNIHAISSHSAYADLPLLTKELYRIPVLNHPLAELTMLWARMLIQEDVQAVRPIKDITNSTIPIMISHSKSDKVIPFEHALLLKQALSHNNRAEYLFFDTFYHGQYDTKYQEAVRDFFLTHL